MPVEKLASQLLFLLRKQNNIGQQLPFLIFNVHPTIVENVPPMLGCMANFGFIISLNFNPPLLDSVFCTYTLRACFNPYSRPFPMQYPPTTKQHSGSTMALRFELLDFRVT